MYELFSFSWLVLALSVCFSKRVFDCLSIFAISSLYMTTPLYWGYVYDHASSDIIAIPDEIYYFFSALLLGVVLIILLPQRYSCFGRFVPSFTEWSLVFLGVILSFGLIIFIDSGFFFPQNIDQPSNTSQLGFLYVFYCWSSVILLALSLAKRRYMLIIISLMAIMLTLSAGSRVFIFIATFLAFVNYGARSGPVLLLKNFKLITGFVILFAGAVAFKLSYQFLLVGDYGTALAVVSDPAQIAFRLSKGSQNNAVILNFVTAMDPSLMIDSDYRDIFLIKIFPFIGSTLFDILGLVRVSFGDFIQVRFFSEVTYGLGSSFWGEVYYMVYGTGILYLVLVLFILLVFFLNRRVLVFDRASIYFSGFLIYVVMYYHRLDFSNIVYIFSIFLILYLFYKIGKTLIYNGIGRR